MTSTLTTPAQALRAALKSEGFSARSVTVRQRGCALDVSIRDGWVSLSKVENIARRFEVVDRCPRTGEILGGGNTFVKVAYSDELVEPAKAAILVVLDPAPEDEWVTVLGEFRARKISARQGATFPEEVQIEGPGFELGTAVACGVAFAAKRIAIAFLDASATQR